MNLYTDHETSHNEGNYKITCVTKVYELICIAKV